MTKQQAENVAEALGGEPREIDGANWVVAIGKPDGSLVVIRAGDVCEYEYAAHWPEGPNTTGIFWG